MSNDANLDLTGEHNPGRNKNDDPTIQQVGKDALSIRSRLSGDSFGSDDRKNAAALEAAATLHRLRCDNGRSTRIGCCTTPDAW